MNYVLTHRADVVLMLAALLLPVYCIAKWERTGFVLGVLAFWACFTAGLWILPMYGEDPDLARGCFFFGGWLVGVVYCVPIYAAKALLRPRTRSQGEFRCPRCGYCQRSTPARCPDCGTAPVRDGPRPASA